MGTVHDANVARLAKALGCRPFALEAQYDELLLATAEEGETEFAAFLAQTAHESGGFRSVRENLNYSTEALLRTFPRRITPAEAQQYGRNDAHQANQEAIANIVYANRMGNGGPDTGDGWKYRGGGWLQITGKDNYRDAGKGLGVDLVGHPELIETAELAAKTAALYWRANHLGKLLRDRGFDAVSRMINLGSLVKGPANGEKDRREKYEAALKVLEAWA